MRPFSEFHTDLDVPAIETAHSAQERSLGLWAYLLLRPGMEFVRQRSNFILGWQAAAEASGALTSGVSAGAVGSTDRPPLGSWMILPDLTTPATQTVLPSNDALYGAAHLELDRQGPLVVSVPANADEPCRLPSMFPSEFTLTLRRHPATPAPVVRTLEVHAARTAEGGIALAYCPRCDLARLRIPVPHPSRPAAGLSWRVQGVSASPS